MTTKLAVRHSTTTRMTMLLACFALAACASEDDESDTNASATISTTIGSATNDPSTATDDPTAETTADPTDASGDSGVAETGTTDPTADTGAECTAADECIDDSMCGGGMCIGCLCIGGDTGTAECGTNVATMNPACDECTHANCCAEVQGCFGDETQMGETPCLQLNNCIATSCTTAMTLEDLQMCIDMNCPDLAGELQNFLMFNNCAAMNCAADCAG